MVNDMMITRSVVLDASPEKVWDVLTNPRLTRQYLGNYEFSTDLRPGGYWRWTESKGGEHIEQEAEILDVVPGRLIKFSGFDRMVAGDISRSGTLVITHEIVPEGERTKLLTTLENFEGDDSRAEQIANQWDFEIMPKLKTVVEAQP